MVETEEELETLLRELEVRIEDLNDYVDDDPTPVVSNSKMLDDFLDRLEERVGDAREQWTDDDVTAAVEAEADADDDIEDADEASE